MSTGLRKLWIVRHAPAVVAPGTCYGSTDLAANEKETQTAARALAPLLPPGVRVLCSPLQRCRQLAAALCAELPDADYELEPQLTEMHFGTWERRRWQELPTEEMKQWTADFATYRPGGGENVAEFMTRIAKAYDKTVAMDRDTLWVTHAGVARAAILVHDGRRSVTRADQWPIQGLAPGEWCQLYLSPMVAAYPRPTS